jgi:hypothetical protein
LLATLKLGLSTARRCCEVLDPTVTGLVGGEKGVGPATGVEGPQRDRSDPLSSVSLARPPSQEEVLQKESDRPLPERRDFLMAGWGGV